MKKLFTFFTAMLFAGLLLAQVPQKMSYQAVIRDATNKLVVNKDCRHAGEYPSGIGQWNICLYRNPNANNKR